MRVGVFVSNQQTGVMAGCTPGALHCNELEWQ